MRKWLIGIDGGGTKTAAALCDETGRACAFAIDGPTNPTSASHEQIGARLERLLDIVTDPLGGRNAVIDGCFAGIGGGGIPENGAFLVGCLRGLLPGVKAVDAGSDTINALNSGVGAGDGIVVIAGTGSSVLARAGGVLHRVGGWGYLLGDEGSGYDLGRRALLAAIRAYDGRGPATVLTGLCAGKLGAPVHQSIARIYEEGRAHIASFAPVLLDAQAMGDPVACEQAKQAAESLCEAILAAGAHLTMPIRPTALVGGIWQPGGFMETHARMLLGSGYRMMHPTLPPVFGAVVEAARLAEVPIDIDNIIIDSININDIDMMSGQTPPSH